MDGKPLDQEDAPTNGTTESNVKSAQQDVESDDDEVSDAEDFDTMPV